MNIGTAENRTIDARNPRTGELDYSFEVTPTSEIENTANELRANQPKWAALTVDERADILREWARIVSKSSDLLEALVTDTGRYFIATAEIENLAKSIEGWHMIGRQVFAEQEPIQSSHPSVIYSHQYKPFEVVGIVGPWNFPFLISLIDLLPALMAGSAAITKPSEITPRFIKPLQETLEQVPELHAVCRYIEGDGQTGQDLINNVDAVCFTGSVKTGKLVYESGAKNFIPVYAELGGKDPVIVTENAEPKESAKIILRASVQATGQACQSIERVYAHESIAEELTKELTRLADEVQLNYPNIREGHIGPLIFDQQAAIIESHISDAIDKGASVLTGGSIENHGGGKWIRPTVIRDVDHSMKVMTDETFGPIIPVMSYSDISEAIHLANDTRYGLSAAVLAGSTEEANEIAQQIDAGAVTIQDCGATTYVFDGEKNWFKYSGIGASRMGEMGMLRFFRKKVLYTQTGEPHDIHAMGER
ncbi:MAG: aldehyde dehydrogenase family protein [Gammaproteobacteria bacterium]|nr:aldehyde dehydrogenase family protein [Gammaproteobacteria bacterium]MDG2297873.1 aldehyde dehydrogenase family protein [Gammaproteobacteria bacterium]